MKTSERLLFVNLDALPYQETLIYEANLKIGSAKLILDLKRGAQNSVSFRAEAGASSLAFTLIKYIITSEVDSERGTWVYEEYDSLRDSKKHWQREKNHFFYEAIQKRVTTAIASFETEDPFVQDILAAVYSLRGAELELGREFFVKTFRKEYPIGIKVRIIEKRSGSIKGLQSLRAGPREQSRLMLVVDSGPKTQVLKTITETSAALWVDSETGIITGFEFKPLGFPLVKLALVSRTILEPS